jgi:hypothetical protein
MDRDDTTGSAPGGLGLQIELPRDLIEAMQGFLRRRPGLEANALLQTALAQFLVQQGVAQPAVRELYLEGLFNQP